MPILFQLSTSHSVDGMVPLLRMGCLFRSPEHSSFSTGNYCILYRWMLQWEALNNLRWHFSILKHFLLHTEKYTNYKRTAKWIFTKWICLCKQHAYHKQNTTTVLDAPTLPCHLSPYFTLTLRGTYINTSKDRYF